MFAEVILLVESAAFKKTLQNYHKNLRDVNNSYYNAASPSGRAPWRQAAALAVPQPAVSPENLHLPQTKQEK